MIWTSYPILYSQIDEILHDLDEFFFLPIQKHKLYLIILSFSPKKFEFPTKTGIKICRKMGVKIEFPTNYSRFSILK